MHFQEKFHQQWKNKKTFLCVGLDTDITKIPDRFKKEKNPLLIFNRYIIEETIDFAIAYKPNSAFYEAMGLKGIEALLKTMEILKETGAFSILDAKRGDIGNTASYYAKAAFEEMQADAVTLAPYMGFDSIEPFLQYSNKLSFVLGLTSNPSAEDFEKLVLKNGQKLYEHVIEKVLEWSYQKKNLGLVIGATQEEEINHIQKKTEHLPLLIPGIGAQGGSLENVLQAFYQENRILFINLSRSILYTENPRKESKKIAEEMREIIEKQR